MANIERRLELTTKFMKMGKALMDEGTEFDDVTISQLGTMLIFLGGLAFDENDVNKFSDLISMFSAKKLFDTMDENESPISQMLRDKANSSTYDDIIKSIEDLRDGPIDENDEDDKDED